MRRVLKVGPKHSGARSDMAVVRKLLKLSSSSFKSLETWRITPAANFKFPGRFSLICEC